MMQNQTKNKFALAACWAMIPTLGGAFGFLAVGYYEYLLGTVLTGILSWSLLISKRSKKIFIYCLVLSMIGGTICHLAFSNADGSISGTGVLLLLLPVMAINVFMVLRIYYIEAGTNDLRETD